MRHWAPFIVSLENKRHFAENFVPGFDERAKAVLDEQLDEETVQSWIDSELKNYGADARLLVARAFRSCLAARRQREPQRESLHALQEELFFN